MYAHMEPIHVLFTNAHPYTHMIFIDMHIDTFAYAF